MNHPEGSIITYFINAPSIEESPLGTCVITMAEENPCHLLDRSH